MPLYGAKRGLIEAFQFDGTMETLAPIKRLADQHQATSYAYAIAMARMPGATITRVRLDGGLEVETGDYVFLDPDGVVRVIPSATFQALYEPDDDEPFDGNESDHESAPVEELHTMTEAGYRTIPIGDAIALRKVLTDAMEAACEEEYAATWQNGWEYRLWRKINDYPHIRALRDLIGEWPTFNSDQATWHEVPYHWHDLEDFAAMYQGVWEAVADRP